MWRGGNWGLLRKDREYWAAWIKSAMLCKDRSSEPTQNIARTSAFLASLAAKVSGNEGEFRLRSMRRYSDRTRLLFLCRSSAVAHIKPFPILHQTQVLPFLWCLDKFKSDFADPRFVPKRESLASAATKRDSKLQLFHWQVYLPIYPCLLLQFSTYTFLS